MPPPVTPVSSPDHRWVPFFAGVVPFLCLAGLVTVWPGTDPTTDWPQGVSRDARLFLVAGLAGALGGALQMARSYAGHLGLGSWDPRWLPWYALRIPAGVGLALLFYVAVRAGLYTNAGGADVNPFGIATICALAGLFSREALEKLDELFDTLTGRKKDVAATSPLLPRPTPNPTADRASQQANPAPEPQAGGRAD